MNFYCELCKKEYPLNSHAYQCECGGLFRLYKKPTDEYSHDVSIGETKTELVNVMINKLDFLLKLENLQPTGSFKDRGAYTLINEINKAGIRKIALDSSGNAGAAIAAYAAAAGMDCTVYVPDDISKEKMEQIEAYGSKIVKVPEGRSKTCAAVKANLGDAYYASHVYNPLFFEGMKSMAYEIYEQMGNKVPDYIFIPAGNGTMLIGLFYGFMEIGRLPHFVAVQSSKCAPIYEAFYEKAAQPKSTTVAEALRIENPKRIRDILMALKNSDGDAMVVDDDEIIKAKEYLGHRGIYVETSAAAGLAGALKFFKDGKPDNYKVVIPLTGNGLKR